MENNTIQSILIYLIFPIIAGSASFWLNTYAKKSVTETDSKLKEKCLKIVGIAFKILKYLSILAFMIVCFVSLPFDEWFVVAMCFSFFMLLGVIVYDFYVYKLDRFAKMLQSITDENEMEQKQQRLRLYHFDLINCDSKEQRTKIIEEIKALDNPK